MARLPRITATEVLRAVKRDGWTEVRSRGGHVQLIHPTKPGRITIPVHTGKVIPPKILASILKQASLRTDDLLRLLD